jgi:amino acid transporter
LGTGGPAFIWSWPIVFAGQLLVGLVFAELASHYPLAGSVFQWTKQVAGRDVAWMDGWIYLVAQVATIASVEFVVPPVIATIFGWDTSNTRLLIVMALVLLAMTTAINILGVRLLAIINNVGVLAELVGMVVLGTLLLLHAHHPVSFLSDTGGIQGTGSYIGVFFAAMLMSLFVVYGFDRAAAQSGGGSRKCPAASAAIPARTPSRASAAIWRRCASRASRSSPPCRRSSPVDPSILPWADLLRHLAPYQLHSIWPFHGKSFPWVKVRTRLGRGAVRYQRWFTLS